jgi:hypothetical protein
MDAYLSAERAMGVEVLLRRIDHRPRSPIVVR